MFIVVTGNQHRMREIPAYLYEGQTVAAQPVETVYGSHAAIVDTGNDDLYRANYLRDRFASGMFGAQVFETLEDATAFVESGT